MSHAVGVDATTVGAPGKGAAPDAEPTVVCEPHDAHATAAALTYGSLSADYLRLEAWQTSAVVQRRSCRRPRLRPTRIPTSTSRC